MRIRGQYTETASDADLTIVNIQRMLCLYTERTDVNIQHNQELTVHDYLSNKCMQSINTKIQSRFYILFQNLQNKFQVQESRISLDTMQSIIYRRIKYILYIADKPWWVLHMYIMYVNFYLQSFLHIQKPCFYFSLYIFIFIYIYIERFFIYAPLAFVLQ